MRQISHLKQIFTLSLVLLFTVRSIWAQSTISLQAVRTNQPPHIDGRLDEDVWNNAPIATDFVTFEPNVGDQPRFKTKIKILYDDDAIYFGAMMFDPHPDSVLQQLGTRDAGEINADMIWIGIDSYHDKQNFFAFGISASNVQTDGKFTINDNSFIYDAIWDSRTDITDSGWVAEVRIPYSAIRFKEIENQSWGLNFLRIVRRYRETYSWSPMDPNEDGIASQFNTLSDIQDIDAPVRLTLMPYISSYLQHFPVNIPGESNWAKSIRGGMDLKYGINESFTLDMTLIPDFGQVKSDNEVLNLSAFETKYDENRPFFTEGIDLFNKAGIFYSRRIGGTPVGWAKLPGQIQPGELLISNPDQSQLINATKISGRTGSNLGIGLFNAISARTYALIEDTATSQTRKVLTQPLTNYNVIVLDQALKNNSYFTFTNTNVWRQGAYENANVSALNFQFRDPSNTYEMSGSTALSQNNLGGTDTTTNADLGMKYTWNLAKVSGKWQFRLGQSLKSVNYDPNDLGFLYTPNELSHSMSLSYNQPEPQGIFQNYSATLYLSMNHLYKPRQFASAGVYGFGYATLKNYTTVGLNFGLYPFHGYDYFEPRVQGAKFLLPPLWSAGTFLSSDYRKKFAIDVNANMDIIRQYNTKRYNMGISPRIRFNDRFTLVANAQYGIYENDKGFASIDTNGNSIFGNRQQTTVTHSINAKYIFTSRMGITFNLRHYWSKVVYDQYYRLQSDGSLMQIPDDFAADVNFNAFTIDMVYSWEFTPGSELSLVWKNNIFNSDLLNGYIRNFTETIQANQHNSFSLKVLYYLDYEEFKRHKRHR